MVESEQKPQNKEIERKFTITILPENLDQYPHRNLKQGYVLVGQDGNLRIRQESTEGGNSIYYQTIKKGSGLIRDEIEFTITPEHFNELWKITEGRTIEKTRYEIPVGDNLFADLDIYASVPGLKTVEVEFNSIAEAEQFDIPPWFGLEVTNDKRYSNSSLAINGAPQE